MPSLALTSAQRAAFRARAHDLKPLVHVGKEGVTPATLHTISDTFRTRDLVKIKVLEMAPEDARTVAAGLAETMEDVAVVSVVGRIVTLHRPLPAKPAPPPKPEGPPAPARRPKRTPGGSATRSRSQGKSRRGAARKGRPGA